MIHKTAINNVFIHSWPHGATLFIDTYPPQGFNDKTECYSTQEIAEKYDLTPQQQKSLFIQINNTFI